MTDFVILTLVFLLTGIGFLAANLTLGRLVRPSLPNLEKSSIYECGESAVGTTTIQFDLRFYVVALLFLIFDVEIVFLFPWATVFGLVSRSSPGIPASVDALGRPDGAAEWLPLAAIEFFIFFGILLVGFAYLWFRGDLNWVRGLTAPPLTIPQSETQAPGPQRTTSTPKL
jgi:NADH-quinone oxidoreductase subunit A